MLHRRTVLYSHSKRNRYPQQTHTLSLNTTRCFGGLGYISANLSIFVVSIGVTIFTKKKSVNSPSHTKKNYYNPSNPIWTISKLCNVKTQTQPQMSNGKRIWRRSCRTLRWSTTVRPVRATGKRTSTSCSRTTTTTRRI